MNDASHSESSAVSSISAAPGTGAAVYVPEHTEQIVSHIEKHAGVPARVLHAVDSADQAAVDIHVVEPSEARPFRTFVTAGMSDFAMVPPKMYSDWKYAELFLCLPTSWRIDYDNWQKDENAWPLRILANIARLPHRHATWIWYGQTLPNGNPPTPLAPSVGFTSLVLLTPVRLPEDFLELPIDGKTDADKKTLHFFSLVPIYADEEKLKTQQGIEALEKALQAGGCTELLKADRASVVVKTPKKSFWGRLFG
ncbi:suppressor of fused domain protein [Geminisphaera colitermitum]|uniref:suppressor of fused domain protein n=1 Tax=Geminisphaera colitermitum TaxID=1148786 RepID=UPI000158CDD9|nr:suppressor of fused domain protein [Geminisphaera colitermitum]